jgi:hypothetical protein
LLCLTFRAKVPSAGGGSTDCRASQRQAAKESSPTSALLITKSDRA